MKKSQMIHEMAEHWFGINPDEERNLTVDDELFDAVRDKMVGLLNFLESRGMKPPIEDVCPVLFHTKGHRWEEEDARP